MDIRKIDLGRDVAEFDHHLSQYFVETLAYEHMRTGRKSIFIGRKGTGKTALLKYFKDKENASTEYVFAIEATHATLVKLDENVRSLTSTVKNLDSGFKLAWLFTSLLALIDRLSKEETFLVTKEERALHCYATKELAYDAADPISGMAQYAISWIKNLKGLGPVAREITTSSEGLSAFDEVRILELISAAIQRINRKGRRVYLFYDKLDERWDASTLYVSFLQGLFLALKDIKATGLEVFPVVLLRDDIFHAVTKDFQHLDHFRTQIQGISWSEEDLRDLIALRIKASYLRAGHRQDVDAVSDSTTLWSLVFPESMPAKRQPVPTYRYLIDRTLARPRDIIVFSNLALENAQGARRHTIDSADITGVEKSYSKGKKADLEGELSARYPRIDLLLEKFRRGKIGFGNEELRLFLLELVDELAPILTWLPRDEQDLLKLLYSVGFLSFTQRGGKARGTRVIHSAIEPDVNAVLDQDRIYISPIFRKGLDLRDH